MTTQGSNHVLAQKLLGDRLTATVRAEGARFVLIVSPNIGDGKTTYFEMVRDYLHQRFPGRFVFMASQDVLITDPWSIPHDLVVVIDGPALNQGPDSLQIPENWLEMIDSAIVVVKGRQTMNHELQECCTRLQAMEIRCLGIIYNELNEPSWKMRNKNLKQVLKGQKALPAAGANDKALPPSRPQPLLLPSPGSRRPIAAREAIPQSASLRPKEGKKKTVIQHVRPPLLSLSINEMPTIIAPSWFAQTHDTLPNKPEVKPLESAKKVSGHYFSSFSRWVKKTG